jgi:hypothetical protein
MSGNITELNGMTAEVVVTIFELIFAVSFAIIAGFLLCW